MPFFILYCLTVQDNNNNMLFKCSKIPSASKINIFFTLKVVLYLNRTLTYNKAHVGFQFA